MTGSSGHPKSFLECFKVFQRHHRQEVIVLDECVCAFAKFAPEVTIINEPERHLCARFCVIDKVAPPRAVVLM